MAPSPPRHLRFKGVWTEEMQKDWVNFQVKRQEDVMERLVFVSQSNLACVLVVGRMFLYYCVGSGFFTSCSSVIFHAPLRFAAPRLRRVLRKQPMRVGISFQLCILVFMLLRNLYIAADMKNELLQHRYFITDYGGLSLFALFVGELPFWVNASIVGPAFFMSWVAFHWIAGFSQAPMLTFVTGLFMVFAHIYLCTLLEQFKWEQFRAYRQLDGARQALEATQETLHNMLSSVWDASCTCNAEGTISSSTPHLDLMLGDGQGLVGSHLSAFAANDGDASRLQGFLRNTALSAGRQALNLQCTFQPQRHGSNQDMTACESDTCDATLYGIRLPPDAAFHSSCPVREQATLFIGVKANRPDQSVPDVAAATAHSLEYLAPNHREDEVSCIPCRQPQGAFAEQSLHVDGCLDDRADSECSFALTVSTRADVCIRLTNHDATTQTEVLDTALPPILEVEDDKGTIHDKGVQTEKQVGISRPPKLHTVNLRRRKCYQANFKETEQEAIEQMILQVLVKLNPKASGCCFGHIGLVTLHNVISEMTAKACNKDLEPNSAWQCLECGTVHGDDDDDDVDCPVCGCEPGHEEEEDLSTVSVSESRLADDEHSERSDSSFFH